MFKAFYLTAAALLALVAGVTPNPAKAFTFTDVQAGDSFQINGGGVLVFDGGAVFDSSFFFRLTQPTQLTNLTLVDLQSSGHSFVEMDLGLAGCSSTSDCSSSLIKQSIAGSSFTAPSLTLAAGLYQVFGSGTFVGDANTGDTFALTGSFTATTPIPPALLMFGTALAGLGGFAFRRRHLGM